MNLYFQIDVIYSGRRLYQYNKDDIFIQVLIFTNFFRITSNLKLLKKLRFLIAFHCFHEYVHPCLNIVRNQN